ncbi:hypothetical protein ZIOFF_068239 [Zingiber officinale]|uniref:UBP-type domain-containing protein n=1 Tax=Zingiber officinale TaxID=94328 RepID=A0A8J5BLE9_ZINOF|nr:hypothetical protein ZIOFF_068239 [Zingiber officinale]
MAAEDSSSTGTLKVDEEELFSVESCWVEARTTCDHLSLLCHHPAENWLCLSCKDVFCSCFINKHMVNHHQEIGHCLALSFSDLSVWCFTYDAYMDNLEIKKINDEKKAALAAQFAAATTLRRVYAAQKDDDTPPIEAILAPLEVEFKLARQELPYGHSDTYLYNACLKLVPLKIFHPFWKAKANFYLGRLDQAFELLKKLEQGKSIVDKYS